MNTNQNIGIDFIGFPKGKLGVGDQLRSLMRLALHNGYKINAIDCFHPSDRLVNDHQEFSEFVTNEFKYHLRIYSLTQNHIAALIYRYGTKFFDNNMNIFHLAWEFEQRPTKLEAALHFGDEIWGISSFTAKAFVNNLNIPVFTMPNSVDMPQINKKPRSYFGLPEDKFLFCFSFDTNSWLTRKNPFACIQAFKEAFPQASLVGLVIKISNSNPESPLWVKLLEMVKNVEGIYIINEVLEKSVLYSLFDCCDAYISLHRSEGFGLGMAENMLLGKPVICTGFSGNMDFCTADNSYLVDYKITDVKQGEYVFAEGFKWADPSVESAALLMKDVFENHKRAKQKGDLAKMYLTQHFSTEALAKQFDTLVQNFITKRKRKEMV